MNKIISVAFFLLMASLTSFAQSIDSLKLNDQEIPNGYTKSSELLCKTPHAASLYEQVDMFPFLGKVVHKDFQSFGKKRDEGSILYFQFDQDFAGQGFLEGLLWGTNGKPTKSEPDEYFAKGKLLIVWSLNYKSDIKSISKAKIEKILSN